MVGSWRSLLVLAGRCRPAHRFRPPSSSNCCAAMSPEDREALMEQLGIGGFDRSSRCPGYGHHRDRSAPRRPAISRPDARRCARRRAHGAGQVAEARRFAAHRHRFQEGQAGAHRKPGCRTAADHDPGGACAGPRRRQNATSCSDSSIWCARAIRISSIRPARCCCRASRRSCWPVSTRSRQRIGCRAIDAFLKLDIKVTKLPVRKIGCRRAQALRLRPVQGRFVHVRAGHRRSGALRLHRRPRRSAQRAAVRQPESHSAPDRRSRRAHQLPRARAHQRRRADLRARRRRHRSSASRAR